MYVTEPERGEIRRGVMDCDILGSIWRHFPRACILSHVRTFREARGCVSGLRKPRCVGKCRRGDTQVGRTASENPLNSSNIGMLARALRFQMIASFCLAEAPYQAHVRL